jgi:tetratricopeptide (TPR) repeat protein
VGGGIRIWQVETGTELITLTPNVDICGVKFSPDGRTLASTDPGGRRVQIWESSPPVGGYELREALGTARIMVDDIYAKHDFYYEVINQLQTDKNLDEAVRKVALQIASSRKQEDAKKLCSEAMKVLGLPDKDLESYRAALEKTNRANALEPNDPGILVVLGLAQYRLGFYENALKTLRRATQLLSASEVGSPATTSIEAMTLHKLGRHEEAQSALKYLREFYRAKQLAENPRWSDDILAEAEKLIVVEKQ